jgi:UDP-glucose 4-epimerase
VDIQDPLVARSIPEGADALIHLAAISRDKDCRENPSSAFAVNVGGTLNLIGAAARRLTRQFVFASSEWVYGEVANNGVQTEESVIDAARIKSEYALTKIAGERLLAMAHSQGKLSAATVLRLGIVYGPRVSNWSAVESLFDAVKTRDQIEVGSLATARRFIHVEDVAEGILASLGRSGFEIFNLSGDQLVSLGQVVEESMEIHDREPAIVEMNAAAASIRNPDNGKARAKLGWSPRMDLHEGLLSLAS